MPEISEILKLLLVSLVLVVLAVVFMSVRVLIIKGGRFSGGSCKSTPDLSGRGITCGCGSAEKCNETIS